MAQRNSTLSYNGALAKNENVLGQKITEARRSLKLSQKDLSAQLSACHIEVSAGAISKWEKGDSMPNPYQLFALCYCLRIRDVLSYFTGDLPDIFDDAPDLNPQGLELIQMFKQTLIASGQFAPDGRLVHFPVPVRELTVKVFDEPAAAGPGNPLMDGSYEMISYPADRIPKGTDFGVRVSGDSMYPRYVDRQIVYVEQTSELSSGEIGVFSYDGEAYIKKYILEQPSAKEVSDYINASGMIVPKITLYSLNRDCANLDVHVKPGHDFQIIGRVLN